MLLAVGRAEAVPDHRRLVAHHLHTGQQPPQQVRIPDVAPDQLVPVDARWWRVPVGLRKQCIEQDRLVPLGGKPLRDVRPDEPGAAGDQNTHEPKLVRTRPRRLRDGRGVRLA
jgi:hypothetical protein